MVHIFDTHVTRGGGAERLLYRNGRLERTLTDVGYIDSIGCHYFVRDYRGDIRTVVGEDGTLEEANSYYPYGMLHGTSAIASSQPYKYTGKELDRENGIDWHDFHARMLMSDLGRTPHPGPQVRILLRHDPLPMVWRKPYKICG